MLIACGADCPACPTCEDGEMNGDETGVDCGGADCPACPTCEDGEMNGDETGVDCGGADCPACPTCEDGEMNGDETGVDCGGADCPACEDNNPDCDANGLSLTIVLDNYPGETSWVITDAANNTVASGGTYEEEASGTTIIELLCLEDGCYEFTMFDSYGDGLCCRYGDGSYILTSDNGTVLAIGNIFGSEETTSFVLGSDPCPTCDDGIQNGTETGVDCGGPDCLPCGSDGCSYIVIDNEDFESGWGIWNDGGADARRHFRDYPYASSGFYTVRLRDNTNSSVMTTDVMDLADFGEITVSFSYYPRSMDNPSEDFWLQISTDGGSSYTTVEEWNMGDEFVNGQLYTDQVLITGPFSEDTRIRFRCDASSNADMVYIDDITVSGCQVGNELPRPVKESFNQNTTFDPQLELRTENTAPVTNLSVYPNPVQSRLNVTFSLPETGAIKMLIMDINGKSLMHQKLHGAAGKQATSFDVTNLPEGIYILQVISVHGMLSKKFMVTK